MDFINKDRVGAVIVFVLCAGAWSQLYDIPAEAAFFPRLILGLSFILTIAWLVGTFVPSKRTAISEEDEVEKQSAFIENPRNLGIFLVCLIIYTWLIGKIGYFTATACFIAASSIALGFKKPIVLAASMAGFILFIYVIFVLIFKRPLPVEFFQPQ